MPRSRPRARIENIFIDIENVSQQSVSLNKLEAKFER